MPTFHLVVGGAREAVYDTGVGRTVFVRVTGIRREPEAKLEVHVAGQKQAMTGAQASRLLYFANSSP